MKPCVHCGKRSARKHSSGSMLRRVWRDGVGWVWSVVHADYCQEMKEGALLTIPLEEIDPDLADAWRWWRWNKRAQVKMTSCRKGHRFTPKNTFIKKSGARICLKCKRLYARAYHKKNPEAAAYKGLRSDRVNAERAAGAKAAGITIREYSKRKKKNK